MPARTLARIATIVLVLGGVAACSLGTEPGPPEPITSLPRDLSPLEKDVVSATGTFGVGLLSRVSRADPDSDIFLSPLSAHVALGMALDGADGSTFDAMRGALALGDASPAQIDSAYASLIDLLEGLDPSIEFSLANSLWYDESYPFLPSYKSRVARWFRAEVEGTDFSDPATVDAINAWVKDATNGKIETLVDRLRRDEIAFLVNAVYFLGDWTERFDPAETSQQPFHLEDGTTEPVQLMHGEGEYRHGRGDDFTAIDLPYGGGAFVMTVVLPDRGVPIDSFAAGLDAEKWKEVLGAVDGGESEVSVYLPRFRMAWSRGLGDVLSDMGMGIAFDPAAADFGRMADLDAIAGNVYLTRVVQKAFVRVDEEGTEAAAATGVGVGVTSLPAAIRVDRPFVFAIRERLSGAMLFLGKFERPPTEG